MANAVGSCFSSFVSASSLSRSVLLATVGIMYGMMVVGW